MKAENPTLAASRSAAMAALLTVAYCACAQGNAEGETQLLDSAQRLRLGDSMAQVRQKLEPPWQFVQTNRFLAQSPFRELMPHTNSAAISEWQSKEIMVDGWPMVLFVVFENPAKTNLVDVLHYGPGVQPLVDGVFQRNLHSIKKGDSVEKVYALLGRKDCQYYKAEDGKWRVALLYLGCRGEFIRIEADAGTGLVVRVSDVTL